MMSAFALQWMSFDSFDSEIYSVMQALSRPQTKSATPNMLQDERFHVPFLFYPHSQTPEP
jgi:hypothetical protein